MAEIAPPARRPIRMDFVLGLLTFASSLTDVLSFLALSQVFTSGMTGNTALLGLALGERQISAASYAASALAGFMLGVACATLLSRPGSHRSDIPGLLGFEASCLVAFCVIWFASDHAAGSAPLYVLIALSATGMGIQTVVARRINAPGIPTVVFTTTLTTIVMAATDATARRVPLSSDTRRQIGIFLVYLAGATVAGALSLHHLDLLAVLPLVAVLAALVLEYGGSVAGAEAAR